MGPLGEIILLSALLAMAVATTIAVITSYYFYRWRRVLTVEGKIVLLPEELIAKLATVENALRAVHHVVQSAGAGQKEQNVEIVQRIGKATKAVSELFETTVSLQRALDQRDAEIDRLRDGYDAELIRRFVARFIRVKIALTDAVAVGTADTNSLHQIGRLLEDALDECGAEEFRPKVGEDFRTATGVADNPRITQTDDSNQNFKITEVLEPGYRFRGSTKDNVIIPARVSIHVSRTSGA